MIKKEVCEMNNKVLVDNGAKGRQPAAPTATPNWGLDTEFAALAQHTKKMAKRLPAKREYLTFDTAADNETYYWSNRIEVVDGRVIITPVLRRAE